MADLAALDFVTTQELIEEIVQRRLKVAKEHISKTAAKDLDTKEFAAEVRELLEWDLGNQIPELLINHLDVAIVMDALKESK
jgi:hypothetical protein